MRRKHYAIGAAILTAGVAAVVLLPQDQQTGMSKFAYLPSDMLSPFSAPPAIPLPVFDAPVVAEAPVVAKAPVVAEIPTSAPIDVPPAPPRTRAAAQPLPEIAVASEAPSETPFAWQGSGGRGQSWTGTGGRSAALNNGSSSFGGFGGGGGGGGGSTHPLAEAPSLPPSSARPQAPAFARGGDDNNTALAINSSTANAGGGGGGGGGGGFANAGGASSIVAPGGTNDGNQGFLNGPAQFASYEAPEGGEQEVQISSAVTVDEPGTLSVLLVSALGLLVARRAKKRNVA